MSIPHIRPYRMLSALITSVSLAVAVPSLQAQQPPHPQAQTGGFSQPEPRDWDNHDGWISLFDGKTLTNWDGSSEVWHVEDGAIVGISTNEHPSGTTNIIYKGGEFSNFRLRLEMKLEGTGANGGVQYRSRRIAPTEHPIPANATPEVRARMELQKQHARWNMAGYQADFDYNNRYTGQLYEQSSPRGIITYRGQVVAAAGGGERPRLIGSLGDIDDLKQYIHQGGWNQVEIIADGHTLTHIINGHVMSVTVDTDPKMRAATGLIALEIEGGGTLKISHRNIYLKKLP